MESEREIPPCMITIDKEGRWYHKGAEMIRRDIVRLFYQHMSMDPMGRYIIEWSGDRCYLEVEDTAYVVRQVISHDPKEGNPLSFQLLLSDDTIEDLQPVSLFVGNGNVLYCRVKGAFPARFTRTSYYQLAAHVVEEEGRYYLPVGDERYLIHHRG